MHMHVQGHARNQIPPGGSKTDFTEPEQIQREGRGRDHPSLQGRCGSVAQCVRPVLYEIQSPVEPMQDGGNIPFSSFFIVFRGGYITYTLYSGCAGGVSCDEPSMTVTLTAAAPLQVSNGVETAQSRCHAVVCDTLMTRDKYGCCHGCFRGPCQ
ncbi:uncharacterized protein BO88DRAFT_17580 [Aspergillus vadensis CBS 113365]|uniref:Uncharacterized protein n=1 Tax=Aspergillus vadensis (strain CBS 113365 / IMI 142717 / IBT 24658) TaxID=1448311 RepID=A0A319BT21_ASPVC|nr:hypothetical protein BO88DRAFT_17580 [Aspergillus vadensis CBS 113365]PYH74619.1 hypothetical protein BO88DRAFT_17580 [Aspergillus vadensis CBS 113365]